MSPKTWSSLALLAALALAAACSSSTTPSVGISGSHRPIVMGLTRQYSVDFPGIPDDSVLWSFEGGPWYAGSVDSTGLFTAGIEAGTFGIIATAMADSTLTDTMAVSVVPYATPTPLGLTGYGIAVSSAGVLAAADNDDAVRFRAGASTTTVTTGGFPVHVAFAPNGTAAFATSMGGNLFRIDVALSTAVDTLSLPGRSVYNLAVRPTDTLVYITTNEGRLYKVAPGTLTVLDSVQLASASNGLAFAPGGGTLWVSTIDAGVVYRLDPATLAKTDSFVVGSGTQRLAVAPSGDSVYVADQESDRLVVIRPSTRTVTSISLPYSPHGVALSADGKRLFVAQVAGARVTVLDRKTLHVLGAVPVGGWPRTVTSVPGTGAMVVSTEIDVVRID